MARCLCSTVRVMKQMGNDLPSLKTSEGGLAKGLLLVFYEL